MEPLPGLAGWPGPGLRMRARDRDQGLYAGTRRPPVADRDADFGHRRAGRRAPECLRELGGRGGGAPAATIGASASTTSAVPSMRTARQAPWAAGDELGDEPIEGRDGPRPAELVGEPELPGRGIREQLAERPARPPPILATGRLVCARREPGSSVAALAMRPSSVAPPWAGHRPRRGDHGAGPGRGRRGWWSSRMPGAGPRSGGRGGHRRSGSSSENTSSRSSSGGRPSSAVRRSSSASLKARIAVRCWPREANDARARPSSSNTRSSRCGPTSVVPFQASLSAVSASRRARASRGDSPGSGWRVRRVADRQPACGGLVGGDLRVRRGERRRRARRAGAPAPPGRRRRLRAAPRPRTGARRALPAPRGSSSEARFAAGARARRPRGHEGRQGTVVQPAGRAPRGAGTGIRQPAASPPARTCTVRRTPTSAAARRATPFTRIRLRAPPVAVRTRATSTRHRHRGSLPADRSWPRPVPGRAPADELAIDSPCGASGPTPAARSPRAGSSCRRRSGPTPAAGQPRKRRRETRTRAGPGSRDPGVSGCRRPSGGGPDGHHDVHVVVVAHRPEHARRERAR